MINKTSSKYSFQIHAKSIKHADHNLNKSNIQWNTFIRGTGVIEIFWTVVNLTKSLIIKTLCNDFPCISYI